MDTSFFIYTVKSSCVWVLVFVDNILLTSNDPKLIDFFIKKLNATFALKDLKPVSSFLCIKV